MTPLHLHRPRVVHPTIEKAVRGRSADCCWGCGTYVNRDTAGVVLYSPAQPRKATIRGHGLYCEACAARRAEGGTQGP